MTDVSFPILLSLRVATTAILLAAPVAVALAWIQARHRYRLRAVVDALILLPLVLPPSVVGYLLIVVFGRSGLVGAGLEEWFGLRLVFTPAAAVLASATVALPIVAKTVQPALEAVPLELEEVGSTLGLGPFALFRRVTLPAAWKGVAAATVLGFARALGEFGATLMFAGSIAGRTNTVPLEIFAAYQSGDDSRAAFYVVTMIVFSCAVVAMASTLSPQERRG